MAKKKPVKEVEELRRLMKEKQISPGVAARFIECSERQVYRWIRGEFTPLPFYLKAIRQGIRWMKIKIEKGEI